MAESAGIAPPTRHSRRAVRRAARRRRLTVVVAAAVVVVGGIGAAWATSRPTGSAYRTIAAGPATVTDTLNTTGTIEPVSEATVSFPVAGQVASVSVQQGQQVGVGQPLAQLNTTSLASAVGSAQSTVAADEAKLAADQASQTTSVSSPTPSSGSGSSGAGHGSGGTSSQLNGLSQQLASGQNAVRTAQGAVDRDLTLVSAAVKQVDSTCPAAVQSLNNPPPSSSSSSTSDTGTTTQTTTGNPAVTDCTTLIGQAQADEDRASADEHTLASAEAALTTALNKANAEVQQAAQSVATASGAGSSGRSGASSGSAGSGGSGGSGGSAGGHASAPASADQLAADQAAVDSANAQLAAAQQSLAAATLVSPIAGTVAQVGLTAGQNASANSTSAAIVIIGPGTSEVTTAVSDVQVGTVKPGQAVSIVPDGGTRPISGTVTQIGALGSTTSSGSASYPVTISLGGTTQPLYAGANAAVAITISSTSAAVSVPTSAVRSFGAFHLVTVLRNGTTSQVPVQIGVVGTTLTQITQGLSAGDQVVLADINAPLPTATNNNPRAAFVGGGGFGGGGFRGGGAGGGGGGGAGGGGRGGG